ncbi:MAG: hypothetical protein ACP5P3_01050 [Ignavibacteria bacterium]
MKNFLNRIKFSDRKFFLVIILLFFLLILLLLKFIFFNKNTSLPNQKISISSDSAINRNIDDIKRLLTLKVDSVMFTFGIKNEWISNVEKNTTELTKQSSQKSKKVIAPSSQVSVRENLWFYKSVIVPKDFSIVELNYEIKNLVEEYQLSSYSTENPKNGAVLISILTPSDSFRKPLAKINIEYSQNIKRETAEICIILDDLDRINTIQVEKILSSPEKFSVIFPNNIDKPDLQNFIIESKRDFLAKITLGTEEDLLSEFRTDMSEREIKNKVLSVCYEFDKASGIYINNPKHLMKLENDVLFEFSKRPLKVYKDSSFVIIKQGTNTDIISTLFNQIEQKLKGGRKVQLYIVSFSENDFQNFVLRIPVLKRKGHRFFTFSEILKRKAKSEAQ